MFRTWMSKSCSRAWLRFASILMVAWLCSHRGLCSSILEAEYGEGSDEEQAPTDYSDSPDHAPTIIMPLRIISCPAEVFVKYYDYPANRFQQPAISQVFDICGKYYKDVMMPNLVGQDTQEAAYEAFSTYNTLRNANCSPDLDFILCLFYFPFSAPGLPVLRPTAPTQGLCEKVRGECSTALSIVGAAWPSQLACETLPVGFEVCHDGEIYPAIGNKTILTPLVKTVVDHSTAPIPQSSIPGTDETNVTMETTNSYTAHSPNATEAVTWPSAGLQGNTRQMNYWRRPTGTPPTPAADEVGCRITPWHSPAPVPSRDIVSLLGIPHSPSCCQECALRVRRQMRVLNKGRQETMFNWVFLGSVLSAEAIPFGPGTQTEVRLTARCDYVYPGSHGNSIACPGNITLYVSVPDGEDCVCARPDAVSSNMFLGTVEQNPNETQPILRLQHMNTVFPRPEGNSRQPRLYRKWSRLQGTARAG